MSNITIHKKIVLLFSAGTASGFGRNATQVGYALHEKGWNVTLIDRNKGEAYNLNGKEIKIKKSPNDALSMSFLANVVQETNAPIILLFTDFPDFELYNSIPSKLQHKPWLVGYAPVDGTLVGLPDVVALGVVDKLVVFTRDAKNEIERAVAALPKEFNWLDKSPQIIGHTFNYKEFSPIVLDNEKPSAQRIEKARKLLFPDFTEAQNAFIVFNGNGPWMRKRIDLTIEGFALFAADKPPEVLLCLPSAWRNSIYTSWIQPMANKAGLKHRLIEPPEGYSETNWLDDNQLNLLYNACDVGINTAGGEGWGLVSFEHAATGAPQIVPGLPGMKEIWGNAAYYLENTEIMQLENKYIWNLSTPRNIADALQHLYNNKTERERIGTACYDKVREEQFKQQTVINKWDDYLSSLLFAG